MKQISHLQTVGTQVLIHLRRADEPRRLYEICCMRNSGREKPDNHVLTDRNTHASLQSSSGFNTCFISPSQEPSCGAMAAVVFADRTGKRMILTGFPGIGLPVLAPKTPKALQAPLHPPTFVASRTGTERTSSRRLSQENAHVKKTRETKSYLPREFRRSANGIYSRHYRKCLVGTWNRRA